MTTIIKDYWPKMTFDLVAVIWWFMILDNPFVQVSWNLYEHFWNYAKNLKSWCWLPQHSLSLLTWNDLWPWRCDLKFCSHDWDLLNNSLVQVSLDKILYFQSYTKNSSGAYVSLFATQARQKSTQGKFECQFVCPREVMFGSCKYVIATSKISIGEAQGYWTCLRSIFFESICYQVLAKLWIKRIQASNNLRWKKKIYIFYTNVYRRHNFFIFYEIGFITLHFARKRNWNETLTITMPSILCQAYPSTTTKLDYLLSGMWLSNFQPLE